MFFNSIPKNAARMARGLVIIISNNVLDVLDNCDRTWIPIKLRCMHVLIIHTYIQYITPMFPERAENIYVLKRLLAIFTQNFGINIFLTINNLVYVLSVIIWNFIIKA